MNKVCLVGRLTKDAELKSTATGVNTVTFDLAVKQNFKTEGEYKTDFIRCVAFRHHAMFLANYGKKGNVVSLEGRLRNNFWEKDNVKHYGTEVEVTDIEIFASKRDEAPQLPEEFSADVPDDDLPY